MHNLEHWHGALNNVNYHMKDMKTHFADSLHPNNMEASIWAVEELRPIIAKESLRQKGLHVVILNSWLGVPLIPLLAENLDIASIDCVDMDQRANDLSAIFNKYYTKWIKCTYHTWDTPFAIPQINAIDADVVIHLNTEQMYPLRDLQFKNPYCIYAMQNSNITTEMLGVNCCTSAQEFSEQLGLTSVYHSSVKTQDVYTWRGRLFYERYQVIGQKRIV